MESSPGEPTPTVADPTPSVGDRSDGSGGPGYVDVFLRTPLLHRIVLANASIVTAGAFVGTAISVQMGRSWTGPSTLLLASLVAGAGLILSLAVNGLLVRWLLAPLQRLEEAAARIQAGAEPVEEEIAVPRTADPSLERLVTMFNAMLRSLARYRGRLRKVAAHSLEAREEERGRLARILQEETAQEVASSLVRLRWARKLEGSERDRALDAVREDLIDALESVRRLARSVRPPELHDLGVENALRALARESDERGGPLVDIQLAGDPGPLSHEVRLTLYRAVQAALLACERQPGGRPGRLLLRVGRRDGHVVAELRDDGEGRRLPASFEDGAGASELFAMRERARLHGGELTIGRDARGTPVSVRIRVPDAPGGSPPDGARSDECTDDEPHTTRGRA